MIIDTLNNASKYTGLNPLFAKAFAAVSFAAVAAAGAAATGAATGAGVSITGAGGGVTGAAAAGMGLRGRRRRRRARGRPGWRAPDRRPRSCRTRSTGGSAGRPRPSRTGCRSR